MIKLSSGNPIKRDAKGNRIFGNSKAHTILLLLLLCRPEQEAEPDEASSPWQDRPEVKSGKKSKTDYVREICEGIDLVPSDIIELVTSELVNSGRKIKPSLREMQTLCRAAMEMKAEADLIEQIQIKPMDDIDRLQKEWGLQYWAIVHYGRRPVGYTIDWYPEEAAANQRKMERKGAKVFGPFAQKEEAWQVAQQKLKEWCDQRDALED